MNPRWILIGILVVLVGLAYASGAFDENVSTVEAPELQIPDETPTAINISQGDSRVTLEKQDDVWVVTAPVEAEADSAAVHTLLENLEGLAVERVVSSRSENYAQYGVDSSAVLLSVTWPDRQEAFWIGEQGIDYGTQYVRLRNDARVLLAEGTIDAAAEVGPWRDKTLLQLSPAEVERVAVTGEDETYELYRENDDWQIQPADGEPAAADSGAVVQWLDDFETLRADGVLSDVNPANVREQATHTLAFTTAGDVTHTLYVRKKEDQVAVVVGDRSVVYKLNSWRLNNLVASMDSLIDD